MKRVLVSYLGSVTVGVALGASLLSARAQIPWATEAFSRQNKFEIYGVGQYLHQADTDYSGPFGQRIKLKLDDTGLGGFGVAYHINDYLAVHGDFLIGPATFRAEEPGGSSYSLGDDGYIQTGRFNLDYNILNRRFTPFVTAGIGYQYLQVDQGRYYDYGYYSHGYYYYYGDYYDRYYYETHFTWNVGAGLRWNVTDNFFIKLTGGAQWLQYDDADNITTQIEAFLALGVTLP